MKRLCCDEADKSVIVPSGCLEPSRKHGISSEKFYAWKAKFGGMDDSDGG